MTAVATLLAGIRAHRDFLIRAHRMSCSDPSDASRKTTYSESAHAITSLTVALEGVAALHYEDLFRGHLSNGCKTCGQDWPCPTITAVTAAIGGGE